jgi:hypothetical protein
VNRMTTIGDGSQAAGPVVSLPSADRDTVPLEGTEQWLGTETTDEALVAGPGDEQVQ